MNAIWTMGFVFAALVSSGAAAAESTACVDTAVAAIQKRYEAMTYLRAKFVQRTRGVAFGGGDPSGASISRGTVQFAKPGKMRWSYEEPEPSLVVSDGKTLWLYDPANAEVQRMPVSGGIAAGAAVHFLLGEGDVRRDFAIEALACGADRATLELVPRVDSSYEKLRVVADLASGQLRSTTVFDLIGNVSEVSFEEVVEGETPGEDAFRFDPPEGVEIIEIDAP
ncbi:MAG: outer membrane lipoprotein carrier protein LolA [Myxococcota bacterium]